MKQKIRRMVLDFLDGISFFNLDDNNLLLISDTFILLARFPNLYYYR